ncbi:hypothetical protein NC797_01985 [Aquibacillus sp. 3ASR75-11]|uniref:Uncharacterized protein n=1 Tax=Terrihalobacillus insolitus TaxID=2950438 RepID=A0A9X3WP63_9BACI|nr:hypothetical protein [Terrihalobacillus insolitus]MDC3412029.1 hypothetical protein [Terrihalobacillus insolitus]MDC3423275.1 hypothetical protein [Terrihalobacillus insolitus]
MKHLDWQMILFVGTSLAHDYWVYWGLPKVYFWDAKRDHFKKMNTDHDDDNKAA